MFAKLFTNISKHAFIENMAYRDHGYREHEFDNDGDCVLENLLMFSKTGTYRDFLYKKLRWNSGDHFPVSDEVSDEFSDYVMTLFDHYNHGNGTKSWKWYISSQISVFFGHKKQYVGIFNIKAWLFGPYWYNKKLL